MSKSKIGIRRLLLPADTNHRGEIFGGVILSEIDLAGAVEARRHTRHDVATVAVKEVKFCNPVRVGDVVTFYTELDRIGTTSITVKVKVEANSQGAQGTILVTTATVVYVAVKEVDGRLRKVSVRP